jgi:hypothetical protein
VEKSEEGKAEQERINQQKAEMVERARRQYMEKASRRPMAAYGQDQSMQPGGAGGLIIPGRMPMTKDYNDYYNMFIEVFMSNEKNIQSGDSKEKTELDDKLR